MYDNDCNSGNGHEKGQEDVGMNRRSTPCWHEAGWSVSMSQGHVVEDLESTRKKVVGEPYEGKPHVRFEVAGDGNRDMVWVIEALSKETESKQAALPTS